MTRLEYLKSLMPIIYPSFYTVFNNSLDELVFLDDGDRLSFYTNEAGIAIGNFIDDKTRCEAINNHFHLFDKVGAEKRDIAFQIGREIAQNLLNSLIAAFPTKKFVVYLELNTKDSTIIRFHQIWDNEPPYFDVKQTYQEDLELFEFKN